MHISVTPPRFGPGSLRLLLAFAVVTSHLSTLEIGRPAVFVFFAMSGYWIAKNLDAPELDRKLVKIFLVSRLLRIFIPFFAVYALAALFFWAAGVQDLKLPGVALIGVASHGRDLLGVSWSLDIELQFYLIAPVLIAALAHFRRAIPAMIIATIIGWYLQLTHGIWLVFSYLPCFIAGMLLWLHPPQVSPRMARFSLIGFACAGAIAALHPSLQPFLNRTQPTPLPEDWFGMAWTALLLPYLSWQLRQPSMGSDRMLGDYSYALYLIHWPVIALIRPYLWPLELVDMCVLLPVIVGVTALFFFAIDRPANVLRLALVQRLATHPAAIHRQHRAMNIIRRG